MSNSQGKGTALITGASAGIGAVYADRLAKRGYDLVLVARNRQRLEDVARRVRAETGRKVEIVAADLNEKSELAKVEDILRRNESITALVNNAGLGSVAKLIEADVDKMEAMIDLNVRALTRLTYAAVPGFVARGKGTVINIASVVGVTPEILNGVYGATKAYVIAFTQSLQHEVADKGVRVQAVLPGATATEFWNVAGFPHQNMPQDIVMRTEDMVDAALAGLDQGEVITIPALADESEWTKYEAARRAMFGKLSKAAPAPRYGVHQTSGA